MMSKYTSAAAEGWGGDRYALLGNEGARILHLATVWDTVPDAVEFADAMGALETFLSERARELGDGLGGFRVRLESGSDKVDVTSWFGVEESDVDGVVASLGGGA